MKKYLLVVLMLGFVMPLFSQSNTRDILYLKNGSIIKGNINEIIPGEKIKIETSDGSIFVFETNEIEKITKEENKILKSDQTDQNSGFWSSRKDHGFIGKINLQYGTALETDLSDCLIFAGEIGYKFNKIFDLSQGIGVLHIDQHDGQIYPLYVSANFNMTNAKVQPYLGLSLGTCLNFEDYFDEIGLYTNLKAGVNFNLPNEGSITLFAGYVGFDYTIDERIINHNIAASDPIYINDDYTALTLGICVNIW